MSAIDNARERIIAKLDRIPDSDAVTLDKADVRDLIAEHERLTAAVRNAQVYIAEHTHPDDWGVPCVYVSKLNPILAGAQVQADRSDDAEIS